MSVDAISPLRIEHDPYLARISQVVDDVMTKEELFRERFHRPKIILDITEQMKKLPLETFLAIADHEFRQCVGKWMASQLVDGIVDAHTICHKLNGGRNG